MTVYIEKPAVNLREELASLRNQGGYSEQQFHFGSLVTNGTFDSSTGWTQGAGFSIGSGVITKATGSGNGTTAYTGLSIPLRAGVNYVAKVEVSAVSGIQLGFGSGTSYSGLGQAFALAVGTNTLNFVANGDHSKVGFRGNNSWTITADNISVFETDGTDVIHTMPKGWVPKDVFEDGLLQREGAAHDYEVVYDGFDYKIKPTVAPTATTETCVIGVKA